LILRMLTFCIMLSLYWHFLRPSSDSIRKLRVDYNWALMSCNFWRTNYITLWHYSRDRALSSLEISACDFVCSSCFIIIDHETKENQSIKSSRFGDTEIDKHLAKTLQIRCTFFKLKTFPKVLFVAATYPLRLTIVHHSKPNYLKMFKPL